ncbi:MAG TPA: flagellar basal body P-ring protein FlgI [Stellaceae bacterium]|jgi:flagellar P-ring protein precursor FlgI|nr:flagellar basal body P-ring protein FlgI [Stellaceae bacterium]
MSPFSGCRRVLLAALAALLLVLPPAPASALSRIKDIADFEGVRDNMLVGYGLVVGLNGTGDQLNNAIFTRESLIGMLERMGVNARDSQLRTENVAAVMVTATLPPFARQGARIDVQVAALGNAKSLLGGTLLVTPMLGADGEVYAVAQGSVANVGYTASGQAASVTKGVPTSGRVADGAIVEREVGFDLDKLKSVNLMLRNPDFTTAHRVAEVIDGYLKADAAKPLDPSTVQLSLPPNFKGDLVSMLTDIEQLQVEPDEVARVVIDEANGVIVMGENVRISTVAVAQGNLTVKVTETPQVSQPNPFAPTGQAGAPARAPGRNGVQFAPGGGGQTVVVPRTNVQVDEDSNRRMAVLPAGVSLQELVNSLNALGVGPRDMISILQAIKAAGALQAEIELM